MLHGLLTPSALIHISTTSSDSETVKDDDSSPTVMPGVNRVGYREKLQNRVIVSIVYLLLTMSKANQYHLLFNYKSHL